MKRRISQRICDFVIEMAKRSIEIMQIVSLIMISWPFRGFGWSIFVLTIVCDGKLPNRDSDLN
jgi:hypothetical protein